MTKNQKKKSPTGAAILTGMGFLLGMGAVFLFGTERGKKYRIQLGELAADFLDSIAEGCQELKDNLSN
ncbi:MAG: hypothetical protein ACE5HS_15545 [bacterium]